MKITVSNISASNHLGQPPLGQPPCFNPMPRPSAIAAALGRALGALGSDGVGERVRRYQCRLSHLGQSIPIPGHFGTVVGVSEQGYLLVQPDGVQSDPMSPDDRGAEGFVPSQGILRIYKPGEIQSGICLKCF